MVAIWNEALEWLDRAEQARVRRGKQDEKSASIRMRKCRRMRDGRRA
jgi:hypothetical protein